MPRERSHQKGHHFQRAVKRWLCDTRLWNMRPREYGDAYHITSEATRVGNSYFDFSLTLSAGETIRKIFYAECKYRDEISGNVNTGFKEYIRKVANTIPDLSNEEKHQKIFAFISNIPPEGWRKFLRDKMQYAEENCSVDVSNLDTYSRSCLERNVFVLVLNKEMVE